MKAILLLASGIATGLLPAASAQELAGEAFASYALDFCVAIADGQDPDSARRLVPLTAGMLGPEPAGDDVELVGPDLDATRDTLLFILGPPDSERTLMAFARADGSRCMAFAGKGEDSLEALRRRLARAGMTWQAQMAVSGLEIFKRNTSNGSGSIELSVVPARRNNVARVIAARSDGRVILSTPDRRADWASQVVTQCAAGIHGDSLMAGTSFAPFFTVAAADPDGSLALNGAPGNPKALLLLNRNRNVCQLAIDADVPALQAALVAALLQKGATQRGSRYIWPKPQGAVGRDAAFAVESSDGPLIMRVYAD